MQLKVLWPGKTRNGTLRELQAHYLKRINSLERCHLFETREAKGIPESQEAKIREIEASGLEKHLKDDYIVCLFDKGREMDSGQFAVFLNKTAMNQPHAISFVVGGFLGLADRLLHKADVRLSLSRMTFSHELTRIVLLEQIYRALTIIKGLNYAK
ncbi:MAG: 23S rRNA (pseudouridine(1915)-N(3))-methyltransferase RlmH [Candidatus Aminicenantaceae bacterium]